LETLHALREEERGVGGGTYGSPHFAELDRSPKRVVGDRGPIRFERLLIQNGKFVSPY